ncbi:T-cell activation Rho GTPase activating protein, putative [Entamoeba invadens IP1]|uniref:T-cell activation Rho GTPase activating protein, putative n=1 Tax=Entamoeba invadens IP1 TaxID=370355 RepID=A0A0A1UGK5_ENTIV|nr:T-cell activation Rho GTPase activating protein, putative [Entamoeba invadens IP1]ELP92752.1 T-cell activation Rho GTPase activating protein, putative [Entamoeba invadens IP1]|eukprot:XP_004259523.1 T-cell activation Rho GTPase activating protein, putative [Entamoeba invadens IP1]
MKKVKNHDKLGELFEQKKQQIPKIFNFWEKQRSFSILFSNKLAELSDIMKTHAAFLEETCIQQIPGFDRSINAETLLEGFVFLSNTFESTQSEIIRSFEKTNETIHQLKSLKKLFDKNKDPEKLTKAFYESTERIKWESPLLFINVFHSFQTLFNTSDLYFSCNEKLGQIRETAQKAKQNYVMKHNTQKKQDVSYCGTTLRQILDAEGRVFYQLPLVIESMLIYLYNKGCTTHGLFRETSNASTRDVEDIYHRMGITEFEDLPPDVVANVLKKFLREMREKVFPYEVSRELLKDWQKSRATTRTSPAEKRKLVLDALKRMPAENVTLLRSLLKLCSKIDSMSDINEMNFKNLAVCLAPTLMTMSKDESSSKTIDLKAGTDIIGCIEIICFILTEHPRLFPNDVDVNVTRRSKRLSESFANKLLLNQEGDDSVFEKLEEQNELEKKKQCETPKKESETKLPVRPTLSPNLLQDIRRKSGNFASHTQVKSDSSAFEKDVHKYPRNESATQERILKRGLEEKLDGVIVEKSELIRQAGKPINETQTPLEVVQLEYVETPDEDLEFINGDDEDQNTESIQHNDTQYVTTIQHHTEQIMYNETLNEQQDGMNQNEQILQQNVDEYNEQQVVQDTTEVQEKEMPPIDELLTEKKMDIDSTLIQLNSSTKNVKQTQPLQEKATIKETILPPPLPQSISEPPEHIQPLKKVPTPSRPLPPPPLKKSQQLRQNIEEYSPLNPPPNPPLSPNSAVVQSKELPIRLTNTPPKPSKSPPRPENLGSKPEQIQKLTPNGEDAPPLPPPRRTKRTTPSQ